MARNERARWLRWLGAILGLTVLAGCGGPDSSTDSDAGYTPHLVSTWPAQFTLNAGASGVSETVNNIVNLTVVSNDPNPLKAEYQAGFVQGHLQGRTIVSARDNALEPWGPSSADLAGVSGVMRANYDFTIGYLEAHAGTESTHRLTRLLFRLLGIYHGATLSEPVSLDFSGAWLPDSSTFEPAELLLGYRTAGLTFMDVYFINATMDVEDVLYYGGTSPLRYTTGRMKKPDWMLPCSAFVKRTADDVIITHATWSIFLSQTMSMTINVNGDMMTVNAFSPGQIASGTDFGYNNKGMMFNETTHAYSYTEARTNAIWIFWRAALAEQFAGSIDEFFEDISLDNSGTYLNGYMLVDAKTQETGLVEMSHKTFVLFRSSGGSYTYSTKPAGLTTDYDAVMLTPDYIMGYNFPVSMLIRDELQSSYETPRRAQMQQLLPGVTDLETAKTVITHHDPAEPGSIFSRYDLSPRQRPFGATDAKVANTNMARAFMRLSGAIDMTAPARGHWMLFGTAYIDGWPFVWSRSQWSTWSHPDVPDAVDGAFTKLNFHLR